MKPGLFFFNFYFTQVFFYLLWVPLPASSEGSRAFSPDKSLCSPGPAHIQLIIFSRSLNCLGNSCGARRSGGAAVPWGDHTSAARQPHTRHDVPGTVPPARPRNRLASMCRLHPIPSAPIQRPPPHPSPPRRQRASPRHKPFGAAVATTGRF